MVHATTRLGVALGIVVLCTLVGAQRHYPQTISARLSGSQGGWTGDSGGPGATIGPLFVPDAFTWNVNFPIVRTTAMNCGQALAGPHTGRIVSTIRPWNVPAHHELLPVGISFALTRAPLRLAPTVVNANDWHPCRAGPRALIS